MADRITDRLLHDVVIVLKQLYKGAYQGGWQISNQVNVLSGARLPIERTSNRTAKMVRHAEPLQGVDNRSKGLHDLIAIHRHQQQLLLQMSPMLLVQEPGVDEGLVHQTCQVKVGCTLFNHHQIQLSPLDFEDTQHIIPEIVSTSTTLSKLLHMKQDDIFRREDLEGRAFFSQDK